MGEDSKGKDPSWLWKDAVKKTEVIVRILKPCPALGDHGRAQQTAGPGRTTQQPTRMVYRQNHKCDVCTFWYVEV